MPQSQVVAADERWRDLWKAQLWALGCDPGVILGFHNPRYGIGA